MIDLRSDTVTKPSAAMREAMAAAEVGDDVYGEDPTVNRLQERVAEVLGKERSIFVPSGTMANQAALKAATQPGDEVICDRGAHILNFEAGMPAVLSGLLLYPIDAPRGLMAPEQVAAAIRPEDHHYPHTRVVELEITSNRGGGSIYPLERVRAIARLARERGLWLHLDGARLWNASVATGIAPKTWAAEVDAVCVCLSKGLGAPVGSMVAGRAEFIDRVHRVRKMLGGGMRQAGLLAAAGLYALDHNLDRLAQDHANARLLAEGLADLAAVHLNVADVETNIVIFDLVNTRHNARSLAAEARSRGLLIGAIGEARVRLVTHLDVSRAQCEEARSILREALG